MAPPSLRAIVWTIAAAFVVRAGSPAVAADRITLPVRIADPAVTSVCGLSVDPATRVGYPAVGLTQVFPGIVTVTFVIADAAGHVLGTHDVAVAPPDAQGRPPQLVPFYTNVGYASASCEVHGTDEAVKKSGGGGGAAVIIGVVAIGGIVALAAGHGGSKSSTPAVTATPSAVAASALTVRPAVLSFERAGAGSAGMVTGADPAVPIALSMPGCGAVASVVLSGTSLLVTAKGPGACTVTLTSAGRSANVSIVVAPAAAATPAPAAPSPAASRRTRSN